MPDLTWFLAAVSLWLLLIMLKRVEVEDDLVQVLVWRGAVAVEIS